MSGHKPPRRKDISGQRAGRLAIISFSHVKNRNAYWNCLCDCGEKAIVPTKNLGHTRSCGCLQRETAARRFFVHGESRTRLYHIWCGMIKRCYDEGSPNYPRYGGRGICVSGKWRDDYLSFRDWARSHGYASNLAIDRINNDGNYEPDNCQWLTAPEHGRKCWQDKKAVAQ